ncbi:branched-chain amino acid aminotransferase [Crassaminicella thermophila]|uniref:Branched-chain amino acid aminotransferase n=1 Tax=Crassaminicella thermophila TaxID=2599308 RepID=A0A5C0SAH6_CRATE|nr:aminotransferase class IV [Crassaminicella thermophila]QEK11555.1 branched-chain amino acid aminotransferase [Crassaminicella thermophila]
MKREAILNYYIYNGEKCSTDSIEVFDNIISPIIYEVIRIIDGIPLFLEDHLERFRKSLDLLGVKLEKSDEEIKAEIFELIKINKCNQMNVKLLCSNLYEKEQDFFVYFVKSHYPEPFLYKKGIHTILFYSERENPNAKVLNTSLRECVNEAIKKADAYEALLVNEDGYIMEGSRSNMFFVKKDVVYTAPAKDVLLGVTRNYIMKVCKMLNIKVVEKAIHEKEIASLDGAFMSGTSVNVLPIKSIDKIKMDSVDNQVINKILEGYLNEMKDYIKSQTAR